MLLEHKVCVLYLRDADLFDWSAAGSHANAESSDIGSSLKEHNH